MFNYTNMFEELDTDSLKVQDDLDRQVWEADDKIKPEISERLLKTGPSTQTLICISS